MRPTVILLSGALGVWLGLHAIRAFLAMLVFNVAEDLPATQLGLVGLAIWSVGLLAWLPARAAGRERAAWRFGALFAMLVVARQAIVDETLTAAIAFAAVVVWIWWLPAFVDLAARRGATALVVPAVVVGLAAQVAGSVSLSGLDLHVLMGPGGAAAALALGGAFVVALRLAEEVPTTSPPQVTWGALALGPYVFLQLTLLANLGRLEALGGWELPIAGLVAGAAVAAAALSLHWTPSRAARAAIAAITAVMVWLAVQGGTGTLAVVPAQAGLALLLAASFTPARGARVYLSAAIGQLLFFALLFALYSDFSDALGVAVWPVAAGLVALPALRAAGAPAARDRRLPLGVLAVGLAGLLVMLAPFGPPARATGPAPAEITVLNYNIHQAIGRDGVPGHGRTAQVIEAAGADIVLLQEVNRVWDLAGGVDTFSWLRSRFPAYHSAFGPMHGVHFGNAIFSRHPIKEWGNERFAVGPSRLPRAFLWAVIETAAGDLLVVTTHLTPYDRGDERTERDAQAARLLEFWDVRGRPMAIFAGDYNDGPDSPAIRRTLAAGLLDVLAERGLGDEPTFHATGTLFAAPSTQKLDYVFISSDIDIVSAKIAQTDASDHLPLVARLRLR
ncbi:MAG: endonuclease/exonuclease/phosphatase family protein [Chloroflexota bacterium]